MHTNATTKQAKLHKHENREKDLKEEDGRKKMIRYKEVK